MKIVALFSAVIAKVALYVAMQVARSIG